MRRTGAFLAVVVLLGLLGGCAYEPPIVKDSHGNDTVAVGVGPNGSPISAGEAIQIATNARSLAVLRQATTTAEVYFAEMGSFTDFTPDAAQAREPNITWNASPFSVTEQVSIRDPQAMGVVLVYNAGNGNKVCAVIDETIPATTFGSTDAANALACTGEVQGFEEVGGPPMVPAAPPAGYPDPNAYPDPNGYPETLTPP